MLIPKTISFRKTATLSILIWIASIVIFIAWVESFANEVTSTVKNAADILALIDIAIGIISFLLFIVSAIFGMVHSVLCFLKIIPKEETKTQKKDQIIITSSSLSRLFRRFLLAILLSFVFFIIIIPFLKSAEGLPYEEMAKVGGNNMNRIVFLFGFLSLTILLLTNWKKTHRSTATFLILFWVIGSLLVLYINLNSAKSLTQSNNSIQTLTSTSCDEQNNLMQAKNCTYIVETENGHGSGFFIAKGYLVTNTHVIENSTQIYTWINGKREPVSLWGFSVNDDIALLKIDTEAQTCSWSDSSKIELAETLYAVGWPEVLTGESAITKGIYSRIVKTQDNVEYIQTDAPINPGNSGGPLVGKCGIVGINEWKYSGDPSAPAEGMGFAITSNRAKPVIDQFIKDGYVHNLPVVVSQQTSENSQPQNPQNNSGTQIYQTGPDPATINGWVQARDWTRSQTNFWNNSTPQECDSALRSELKDLLARMSSIIETIVPKMMANKPITNEEDRLLYEFNSMQNRSIEIQNQMFQKNYKCYFK